MKQLYILFTMGLALAACQQREQAQQPKAADPAEVLAAERAFSQMSADSGARKAFAYYMDSSAVKLEPFRPPVRGNELLQLIANMPGTELAFTWVPLQAFIAASGDMGYTYGTWTIVPKDQKPDKDGKLTPAAEGCYTSFWRKNAKGEWKVVLDTGTPGLKPREKK